MLEEKLLFEWGYNKHSKLLTQKNVKSIFNKNLRKTHPYISREQLFLKIGTIFDNVNMEFRLNGLYSGGNRIQEVDDVEFVCNALKEVKNYRIIGDNIVKKSDFMTCGEGNCFLVYENMPIFEIDFGNQECC